ncbi:6-carboxytetrahydropterin synthase [Thalassotalea sp. LPB0316]|uniref:6-carboxytetrahydropterin synthase n=1 Tax=Thalassotalea sp. LPB0316 TaxID=2769490 RepID=UPI001866321D|nr:6-carboxytetrahydropterin synthase [Thalassotalea sp. LPB0316]QOL24866.1 6-carboxytetrahydropterin synthase [Thalassotalea sp. LPB0316]
MQLFVKDLTVIDFSYLCEKRGIVGESWIVDVLLDGALNEMSMVLDFGVVKKQIKAIIDDAVDHKLLLPMQSANLRVMASNLHEAHEFVDFESDNGCYYLQSPNQAFAKIDTLTIDIPSVTQHVTAIIKQSLPDNVEGLTITLREEAIEGEYYHYTHGLKKHDGNCQRIAHGHRSTIEVYENGERSLELEQLWCERWRDIYLASEDDAIAHELVELSDYAKSKLTEEFDTFAYTAPQGRFDIAVERQRIDVVDCDSTVELLADFIARQLKKHRPLTDIKVVAYEGVGKGAIADA